ncbi:MAG: hypothetical protein WC623_24095 [Pedobacter sp.]|uniref:hypothetical protein n=1 Tax=Pedobacter sp. TaxID=1411316 RepID=UPI00356299A1
MKVFQHPELQDGEVLLNFWSKDFYTNPSSWNTTRWGKEKKDQKCPVFVQTKELLDYGLHFCETCKEIYVEKQIQEKNKICSCCSQKIFTCPECGHEPKWFWLWDDKNNDFFEV